MHKCDGQMSNIGGIAFKTMLGKKYVQQKTLQSVKMAYSHMHMYKLVF